MESISLPESLRRRVFGFMYWLWGHSAITPVEKWDTVERCFSVTLRLDIAVEIFSHILRAVPTLRYAPDECIGRIGMALSTTGSSPNEYLLKENLRTSVVFVMLRGKVNLEVSTDVDGNGLEVIRTLEAPCLIGNIG